MDGLGGRHVVGAASAESQMLSCVDTDAGAGKEEAVAVRACLGRQATAGFITIIPLSATSACRFLQALVMFRPRLHDVTRVLSQVDDRGRRCVEDHQAAVCGV